MVETFPNNNLIAVIIVCSGLITLAVFLSKMVATLNLYQTGIKLYQQKDYKGAELVFRQVRAQQSSNDMVRLLLGDALMQQDKVEEAIAVWQELSVQAPKNVDVHLRLGTALIKQDKLADAIAALAKARDLFKAQRHPEKADKVERLLNEIGSQQNLP